MGRHSGQPPSARWGAHDPFAVEVAARGWPGATGAELLDDALVPMGKDRGWAERISALPRPRLVRASSILMHRRHGSNVGFARLR